MTEPAHSPATLAALHRSDARYRELIEARAATGRCTRCGDDRHAATRCPTLDADPGADY